MRRPPARRASLSANVKLGNPPRCSRCAPKQEAAAAEASIPFAQEKVVKRWGSTHNVAQGRPEEEEAGGGGGGGGGRHRRSRLVLNLNVGGKCFKISCRIAARYPATRVGRLALAADPWQRLSLCDDYSVPRNEYFFDRDPLVFHYVFHFYRSGVMWVMEELCPSHFVEEIEYWGVPLKHAPRCCRILFEEKQDELSEHLKVQRQLEAEVAPLEREETFEGQLLGGLRRAVWNLIERPYSSVPAKCIAILSSFFVLLSIVGMTLSTVKEMQHKTSKRLMEGLETVCAVFFTLEYLLRLLSAASCRQFLRAAFSAIDLVAILPFYVQLLFETLGEAEGGGGDYHEELHRMRSVGKLGKVLKLIKLMRIFRLLKLARHSTGLRAFGFTLRQCYQQVCCLLLFIAMGVFTFSALMHSVEHDVPGTNFTSIPDAWWWAAVSLSTVGYGDTVPDTLLGRMVAFGCISFGIILNGMPISILYNKFSDYYAKLKSHEVEHTSALKAPRQLNLKERAWRKFNDCLCAEYAGTPGPGGAAALLPPCHQPAWPAGRPVALQPARLAPLSPRAPSHGGDLAHLHPAAHLTPLSSHRGQDEPYVFHGRHSVSNA